MWVGIVENDALFGREEASWTLQGSSKEVPERLSEHASQTFRRHFVDTSQAICSDFDFASTL